MADAAAVDEVADALREAVGLALDCPSVELAGLERLSGGASRETWAFDALTPGGAHSLILRRAAHSEADRMLLEAAAMREAARAGVPEPEVLAAASTPTLGAYVLMRRVDGETIPRRILRDDTYAGVRPALAGQCGRILAALHTIDPARLPLPEPDDPVDTLCGWFDATDVVSPTLELTLRWLDGNRPAAGRRVVVHGDFRNGNLIVGADGIRAVLDWELVHLGDPVEDLGWLCTRAWRFGAVPPVGGFGDYGDLVAAYQTASGETVPRETLRWWELYGTVRWGVMCGRQAQRHLSGEQRSVELAAIGRRLAEQELDCLDLLEGVVQ
jgi:aminoglycoside phosphotransferase (APT) family kinase protein